MQATWDKAKDAMVAEDVDMHPSLTLIPLSQCKVLYQPTLGVLEAEAMDVDTDEAALHLHLLAE